MPFEYSTQYETDPSELTFEDAQIARQLEAMYLPDLLLLRFGVIGFDAANTVVRYNLRESSLLGRPAREVMGRPIDEALTQILNASQIISYLNAAIEHKRHHDWVFRCDLVDPVGGQVRMRMVYDPSIRTRYLLIQEQTDEAVVA